MKIVLLLAVGFLLYQLLRASRSNSESRIGGTRRATEPRVPRGDIADAEFSDCEPLSEEEERGQEA